MYRSHSQLFCTRAASDLRACPGRRGVTFHAESEFNFECNRFENDVIEPLREADPIE